MIHRGTGWGAIQLVLGALLGVLAPTACKTDCNDVAESARDVIADAAVGCEGDSDCVKVQGTSCFPVALCGAAVHRDHQASVERQLSDLGEEYDAGDCDCIAADCVKRVAACVEGSCVLE